MSRPYDDDELAMLRRMRDPRMWDLERAIETIEVLLEERKERAEEFELLEAIP